MKLNPIASNMTEVTVGDNKVLFSYQTPVAVINLTPEFHAIHGTGTLVTSTHWSATTTRHINKWLGFKGAKTAPQEFFDSLV
jgi:hypothetical protein